MTAVASTGHTTIGAPLRVGRGVVVAVGGALLVGFVVGLVLWGLHSQDLLPRWIAPESWSASDLRSVLASLDTPVSWLFAFFVLLELVVATVAVVAAYFVLRGAVSWFRLYLALVLVLFGTMSGSVPLVLGALYPDAAGAVQALQGLAWVALFPLAYVFPDGRFVPRWSRWLALCWLLYLPFVGLLELVGIPDDALVALLPLLALFGSAAVAAIYRYARVATPVQRSQIRWVVVAIALRFAVSSLSFVAPLARLDDEVGPRGLVSYTVTTGVSYVVAALLPAAVAVAIVRHHLFDVDVWLNRALVYALLSAFVIGTYALVVAGVGAAWPGDQVVLPVIATALVAVVFHPVRERVQRAVSRLVYGQRAEPYTVVAGLGTRLESALPPDAVLQTIVDTLGPALRLRYARAALTGEPGVTYPATAGEPPAETVTFPLRSHDEQLGELTVAVRPGEKLGAAERQLIAEVTRQAGIAVRAATLTTALRRSRERVVRAREEERRRLHRDLHDGLGPTLASLYQRVDAARAMVDTDPATARQLLADAGTQTRAAIGDIRRLVYQLRPPALDELGLVAAIEETCRQLNARPDRLVVDVRAQPLPPLPAVVEVAAYRIAVEAVTNIVRHAAATRATVVVSAAPEGVVLEIADDGAGIGVATPAGVGLASMRERAEEIGGELTVGTASPHGTLVRARLPLAADAREPEEAG